jgi:drug/metabolite transporter superfamily protein YnfA
MTKVGEIVGGYATQQALKQSKLIWGLTVAKLVLRNPGAFKKLMVMGRTSRGTAARRGRMICLSTARE